LLNLLSANSSESVMRSFRLLALLSPLAFTACLSGSETQPSQSTPIDCATLATGLTAAEPTLTTTASGLKYRDVTVGTGATVNAGQQVAVHYSGCLTSGVKFDQNSEPQSPVVRTLGATPPQLIEGFEEGLIGMKVGGRRQLVIPPELAYGSTGSPPAIPPDATLVFTVDLVATQ
jgi:FKBP-type peptidyl-prolyl cis-trans isomerase